MRTTITKQNLSNNLVKEGLSNKDGMFFEDTPSVRKEIAKEVDNILKKIRANANRA